MIEVREALSRILDEICVLEAEERQVERSLGQVTVSDIHSAYDIPAAATAMPDGYAVRSSDIRGATPETPVSLRVIGSARAGRGTRRTVTEGMAMRIMTGAIVPEGADCVVRFEETDEPGDKNGPNPGNPRLVRILKAEDSSANMRPSGSGVRRGAVVMRKGTVIGPPQLSVLASIGMSRVEVVRRPTVAIIATGDELVSRRGALAPGKSYDANTPALSALVERCGAIPWAVGIARDSEESLRSNIEYAVSADLIITTGGVSKGDFDLVRLVLGRAGRLVFNRVFRGPGASFTFGFVYRSGDEGSGTPVPVFALSGPPVGAMNNFDTFVRPAILRMMGYRDTDRHRVTAVCRAELRGKEEIDMTKWTRLESENGEFNVYPAEGEGSLLGVASADSFVVVPAGKVIAKGERVEVSAMNWFYK